MWYVRFLSLTTMRDGIAANTEKLYSFIAQIDNSLNAKIAVSSARDSSAMKTLALITTLFLPGTYVAVCRTPFNSISVPQL